MKLGQNIVKYFVRFWDNGVSRKNAFETFKKINAKYRLMLTRPMQYFSN